MWLRTMTRMFLRLHWQCLFHYTIKEDLNTESKKKASGFDLGHSIFKPHQDMKIEEMR